MQAATSTIFHEGFGVPINVLEGANEGKDVWIGFSSGDIAIMNIGAKTVGTRWKAHPGGVSCIVALNDTVWSGDHYVQYLFSTHFLLTHLSQLNLQVIIDIILTYNCIVDFVAKLKWSKKNGFSFNLIFNFF